MISDLVMYGINFRLACELIISGRFPQSLCSFVQDIRRTGFREEEK